MGDPETFAVSEDAWISCFASPAALKALAMGSGIDELLIVGID
jgi:hypothetical protein